MKKLKFALLALVSGVLLSSCSNTGDKTDGISKSPNVKMDETFFNPLDIKEGIGDPWLYKHTDGYYYYTHSSSGGLRVTKTKSMTLLADDINDESRTKIIFVPKSIDNMLNKKIVSKRTKVNEEK